MAVVAVCGELVTTTSAALAAAWAGSDDGLVVEADPSGGDLAAWFDLPESPSLSTLVTRLREPSWAVLEAHRRVIGEGLSVITCPAMPAEAALAVAESAPIVVPMLSDAHAPTIIVDTGRNDPRQHPFASAAGVVVIVHRQSPQSARAAAVRLRRLPDRIAAALHVAPRVIVAVVGSRPFEISEISGFLTESVAETLGVEPEGLMDVVGLADDPLAAAVLGGRTGVSGRRLARLPLMRSALHLAELVVGSVDRSARVP